MSIKVIEISTQRQLKKFAQLPYLIYKNNPYWLPPLFNEEIAYFNFLKDYFGEKTKFFVVQKNDELVGRIITTEHQKYNELTGKKYLRLSKCEFIDDYDVSRALFDEVANLAKSLKLEYIHGPLGITNLDTQGLLIEGFEYVQSIGGNYHLPYYKNHFEKYGFEKQIDWLDFRLTLNQEVIEKGLKAIELIKKRYDFNILSFTKNSQIIKYKCDIFETINDAFSHLPFVIPFDEKLIDFYTKKYLNFLNPKYFKIATKDGQVAGFIVANPSVSNVLKKINGKVTFLNFFRLFNIEKNNDTADFLLAATKKQFQKQGLAVILFAEIQNLLYFNNFRYCEITGNIETNNDVLNNWKNFEYIQHKRRRCFIKAI